MLYCITHNDTWYTYSKEAWSYAKWAALIMSRFSIGTNLSLPAVLDHIFLGRSGIWFDKYMRFCPHGLSSLIDLQQYLQRSHVHQQHNPPFHIDENTPLSHSLWLDCKSLLSPNPPLSLKFESPRVPPPGAVSGPVSFDMTLLPDLKTEIWSRQALHKTTVSLMLLQKCWHSHISKSSQIC